MYHVAARTVLLLIAATQLALACESGYLIWIPRSQDADPLYRFVVQGKAGYIDRSGTVVIPPTFEAWGNGGGEFHAGLLETTDLSEGKYVDREGKRAFDKDFYFGWDFSEGLAGAMEEEEGLRGYLDSSGEFAISPRFSRDKELSSFSDGLARIRVNRKYGYIDRNGDFAIEPRFLEAEKFVEGMARVVVVDEPCWYVSDHACGKVGVLPWGTPEAEGLPFCKYTFVNKSGKLLDREFDRIRDYGEEMAPARVDGEWGYIDSEGRTVIKPSFDDAWPFSDGLARVRVRGKFGFIDTSGAYVKHPIFERAEDFADGLAPVEQTGYHFIDTRGEQAFPGRFAQASPFFKGLAHVQLFAIGKDGLSDVSRKFAYINTFGEVVFSYEDRR
jgi:hypothetical protein